MSTTIDFDALAAALYDNVPKGGELIFCEYKPGRSLRFDNVENEALAALLGHQWTVFGLNPGVLKSSAVRTVANLADIDSRLSPLEDVRDRPYRHVWKRSPLGPFIDVSGEWRCRGLLTLDASNSVIVRDEELPDFLRQVFA